MLKKRLIPKIQLKKRLIGQKERFTLVTTKNFNRVFEIGDPVSQARIYQAQCVDELFFINIDRTSVEDPALLGIIQQTASEVFMPITVGGGVRSVNDFRLLLQNGADKVVVNSITFEIPSLITDAAHAFGSQCVVASIDYRKDGSVFAFGGKENTGKSVIDWAKRCVDLGAGELLLTCIDQDGTKSGLECEFSRQVIQYAPVPVVISGGCGLASHFIEGFQVTNASGVSAGTFFAMRDQNPIQTRAHILNAGISIRKHH